MVGLMSSRLPSPHSLCWNLTASAWPPTVIQRLSGWFQLKYARGSRL